MKTSSCKAKGRKLQQVVRDAILATFPGLTNRDVASTAMGQAGDDIQLSEAAFSKFPYSVECKNLASVAIYKYYNQRSNPRGEPILVVKQNHSEPLAVISLKHFMSLIK
jgi:hypothetical protein